MKYEIIRYWKRGDGFNAIETSHIYNEVPQETAEFYMSACEHMGCTRHETETQIFYDQQFNSNESCEYIFWK